MESDNISIIENKKLTETDIDNLSDALKKSDKAFQEYIGKFESADTGNHVSVYTDKNGLLTI